MFAASFRSNRLSMLALFFLIGVHSTLAHADWPGWRGPQRNGTANVDLPVKWPQALQKKWSVEVGSGHSSPVWVGDRIYQLSRMDDQEVCAGFDIHGKRLWKSQYDAPYKMNPAARGHGKGPKSTPAFSEGKLYTLGISGIVSCFDGSNGEVQWRKEYSQTFPKTSPLYGAAMSPLIVDARCYFHVGGHDDGAMMALDKNTGEKVWQWSGDGPSYASPIRVGGPSWQLVSQSQTHCFGLSPSGKLLWSMEYKTGYHQNSITPVLIDDLIVLSGYGRDVRTVRLNKTGDAVKEAWVNPDVSFYMSTPVVLGSRLFGFAQQKRGQLIQLDATSGKLVWAGPPRQGDNASLVVAGDVLFCLTTKGELIVVDAKADRYVELARYKVSDSPVWAHLVIEGKRLLIKNADSLAMWELP